MGTGSSEYIMKCRMSELECERESTEHREYILSDLIKCSIDHLCSKLLEFGYKLHKHFLHEDVHKAMDRWIVQIGLGIAHPP